MKKIKLPKKLVISGNKILDDYIMSGINDGINEYLSNEYGFCINDYTFEIKIKVNDIDWDDDYDDMCDYIVNNK